jgi:hypothetical protein
MRPKKASPPPPTAQTGPIDLEDSDSESPSLKKQRVDPSGGGDDQRTGNGSASAAGGELEVEREGERGGVGSRGDDNCGWSEGDGLTPRAERMQVEGGGLQQGPVLAEGSARLNARTEPSAQVTFNLSMLVFPRGGI